jgi:hypothetical protein
MREGERRAMRGCEVPSHCCDMLYEGKLDLGASILEYSLLPHNFRHVSESRLLVARSCLEHLCSLRHHTAFQDIARSIAEILLM